jgi:flagellin
MGLTSGIGANMSFSSIATRQGGVQVLSLLQGAIASVSRWRGILGAQQNRLINSVAIIQVQAQNLQAAESVIMDANMAEEVVNMTKYQILLQSGMSSLAQANASAQLVLQLLG